MGLEKIKEEILQKAQAEEQTVLAEAESKAAEIRNNAKQQAKQLEKDAAKKLEADMRSIETRETALVNMESQKLLFEAKKEIMDAAYQDAFDNIRKMPAKERETLIRKLLDTADKEIDVGVVYANDADRKHCGTDVKELKTDGGVICETKDGTIRVNLTFENMFTESREKTSKEIAKILFE